MDGKIKYRTSPRGLRQFCQLGLKHKLYIDGYVIRDLLECNQPTFIAMYFYEDKPVGILTYKRIKWDQSVNVFVKRKFRRKGIGSALLKCVRKHKKNITICPHSTQAESFFKTVFKNKFETHNIYNY